MGDKDLLKLSTSPDAFSIFVIGASGDLALKKTFPALFDLFVEGLLPGRTRMLGYARTEMTDDEFRDRLRPVLEKRTTAESEGFVSSFLRRCVYRAGPYDIDQDGDGKFAAAAEDAGKWEERASASGKGNRLFYFALPPTVYATIAKTVRTAGFTETGWNRVVIEKPFGKDLASSDTLQRELEKHLIESQMYRIDHYLGKGMVQNLFVMRFGNTVFEPLWNRQHVQAVSITFKEPFGTQGRAGYFDSFGILRDIIQNHLLQVLSLVAMEQPVTMSADDVRDEKVRVLRSIDPPSLSDVVLGQYGRSMDGTEPAYREEDERVKDSVTPTFATVVLRINNPRWAGVPFIVKAGKGLNERKAEVRIQFRSPPGSVFGRSAKEEEETAKKSSTHPSSSTVREADVTDPSEASDSAAAKPGYLVEGLMGDQSTNSGVKSVTEEHPNELVIRIQPDDAVYLKCVSKLPGLETIAAPSELNLSYQHRFPGRKDPEAYARLLLDVLRGDQSQFVRADELHAAWSIFTPLLHKIEGERVSPLLYRFGSRGPPESDALIRSLGVKHDGVYAASWQAGSAHPAVRVVQEAFALPRPRLMHLYYRFWEEMERGLRGEDTSTLAMYNTRVTHLPNGREKGHFYGLDVGGTNARVVRVTFQGDGSAPDVEYITHTDIPDELIRSREGKIPNGTDFFAFLAQLLVDAGCGSREGVRDDVGFVFSFPTEMDRLDSGRLVKWTKEWNVSGVVGEDVVRLLSEALAAKAVRGEVRVRAVLSDTVATFLAGRAKDSRCVVGLILGTGTNACYVERVRHVTKLGDDDPICAEENVVINLEWGHFGSAQGTRGSAAGTSTGEYFLPLTQWDREVNDESDHPSQQVFEKMISGHYQGIICNKVLRFLVSEGALFSGCEPTSGSLCARSMRSSSVGDVDHEPARPAGELMTTKDVFDCIKDRSATLSTVSEVVERLGGPHKADLADLKTVRFACQLVARRAARLTGVGIAAILSQVRRGETLAGPAARGRAGTDTSSPGVLEDSDEKYTVAVDGSLFSANLDFEAGRADAQPNNVGFDRWIHEALSELGQPCNFILAKDGTAPGGGILAAVASENNL